MATIYSHAKRDFVSTIFGLILNLYVFIALTIFLAVYTLAIKQDVISIWGLLTLICFVIVIRQIKDEMDYRKFAQQNYELHKKLATELPDDAYIFLSTPVSSGRFGYTVDIVIVTRDCVFVLFKEHGDGFWEGSVDHDLWKITYKKRGKTVTEDVHFPISILRQQTYHTGQMLTEKGVRAWVQGVLYFANEDAKANGTGRNTAVIDDPDELIHYIKNYKPRFRMDENYYEKCVKVMKKRRWFPKKIKY